MAQLCFSRHAGYILDLLSAACASLFQCFPTNVCAKISRTRNRTASPSTARTNNSPKVATENQREIHFIPFEYPTIHGSPSAMDFADDLLMQRPSLMCCQLVYAQIARIVQYACLYECINWVFLHLLVSHVMIALIPSALHKAETSPLPHITVLFCILICMEERGATDVFNKKGKHLAIKSQPKFWI